MPPRNSAGLKKSSQQEPRPLSPVEVVNLALERLGSTRQRIVDIITFAEDPAFLGRKLYPRQKEILREFFDPSKKYNELLLIAGRRSSKTFMTAVIASYLAYLWLEIPDPYALFEGIIDRETPVYIITIATKPKQARILLDEIKAKIRTSPYFKDKIVKDDNQFELWLSKNLIIEAVTSNSASEVGKTAIAVLFDEIGKYGTQQGTRDGEEVYDTMSKSIGTFGSDRNKFVGRAHGDPGLDMIIRFFGRLVEISTPMAKQGILWRLYNAAQQVKTMLLYQLATWEINPHYPRDSEYMRSEYAKNPRNFNREYGAQFSDAVDGMLPPELVEKCAMGGETGFNRYFQYLAALDTSLKRDAFAMAIGHNDDQGRVRIDLIRYWIPDRGVALDWTQIKASIENLFNTYMVEQVIYDQYQSEAVRMHFKNYALEETTFTQPYKMLIYKNLEDLMWQDKIKYPDNKRLIAELKALQRTWNGDRFSVHHPESGPITNDDGPDVIANLAYHLFNAVVEGRDGDEDGLDDNRSERERDRDGDDSMVLFSGGGYT
jgi:hypothetical protein